MGLFVCSKCNCVENTALGWWWSRNNMKLILPDDMKEYEFGKGLCSECMPASAKFDDGTLVDKTQNWNGKWHNRFSKVNYDEWKTSEEGKHYKRSGDSLTYKS